MNIIPFVTIFLLTISLIIFSTVQSHQGTKATAIGLEGNFDSYREAKNDLEVNLFKSKKKTAVRNHSPKPLDIKRRGKIHKTSRYSTESASAKFNVSPLLNSKNREGEKERLMKEALVRLIKIVYEKAPFFQSSKREDVALALVEELLESPKKIKEIKNIGDLIPTSEDLSNIWYKMLRGSCTSPTEGFPPVSNYLIIGPEDKAVSFKGASIYVLEAVLGKETTQKILEEEEIKYKTVKGCSHLKIGEYTALLKGENSKKLSMIQEGYWKKGHQDRFMAEDSITKITANIPAAPITK